MPRPSGHFVLLPSHGNALLLKSVAVKEFLLPCDFVPSTETSIDSALDGMKQSLSKVITQTSVLTYTKVLLVF